MKRFLSVFLPVIVTAALLCGCGEARVRRLATRMMKSEITVPQNLELMNGKYITDSSWLEGGGNGSPCGSSGGSHPCKQAGRPDFRG
ncbi:MAG: hypothetical protein IAC29_09180 [Bacteroidetes bacterium]|uniref:Lipoprotein n=1 Tax=Candidatus Cryptobacteroides merdigallinarum TaxID=2840770 RepID=A0A9D9EM20_9BACT|nr:hypothetical protein [Candidatus Cryptobacteroides merdigallinarum]